MSERLIDLHLHTTFSDGCGSPEEAVKRARFKRLAAISITDHDTFGALDPALALADDDLEIISGVELSCQYENTDFHVLAYFIDYKYAPIADKVKFYQEERLKRGRLIVAKLNEMGIDLQVDTVMRLAAKGAVGRPHVADALVQEEFVHTVDEAFSRYLGYHAPAYVPKTYFDPAVAIKLVHEAGGLAVLAHPGTVRRDEVIGRFKEFGLDGIEVYHAKHTPAVVRHYKRLAEKYDLLISGGSDWHGRNDPRSEIGSQKVPYSVLQKMKEYLAGRHD
ncbi:MAG: PHP domain-containing protein [candidate division Zixibacteria bacterium]|nr:PHP domain-containing protein [candidate division Zixibacteria bacterium]